VCGPHLILQRWVVGLEHSGHLGPGLRMPELPGEDPAPVRLLRHWARRESLESIFGRNISVTHPLLRRHLVATYAILFIKINRLFSHYIPLQL
jgi:hypothetical protein